jgi:hypothetical protein
VSLRVVLGRDVVDVFLDEELMLSAVAEGYAAGHLALVVDDARARFEGVRVQRLALPAVQLDAAAGRPASSAGA